MALNWIDVNEFSFNCILMMERFQLRYLCASEEEELLSHLGLALRANPAVAWYLAQQVPEAADKLTRIMKSAPDGDTRASECRVLAWMEDFVTYTRPECMATHCDFIFGWDPERLYELCDLDGKRVLDVGSGSGRLAFAAAKRAREVYASEPVGTLRAYLRDRCQVEGIGNVRVVDGFAAQLPYPDNLFDVVMSGHVVGDELDAELAELRRVCRDGGMILDCPGDQRFDLEEKPELIARGFECLPYTGSFGKKVCRYRMKVYK